MVLLSAIWMEILDLRLCIFFNRMHVGISSLRKDVWTAFLSWGIVVGTSGSFALLSGGLCRVPSYSRSHASRWSETMEHHTLNAVHI